MLVTIIFIYEKRWKPEQTLDENDPGTAPTEGHHVNDKDKSVHQRNPPEWQSRWEWGHLGT